jgi:hypothetical protein
VLSSAAWNHGRKCRRRRDCAALDARAGRLRRNAFIFAWTLVGICVVRGGVWPPTSTQLASAAFFFAYGLFTISIGYQHPNLGYYSFDRVSQVASILVLGPVEAALINGLASLVYPLHRLRRASRRATSRTPRSTTPASWPRSCSSPARPTWA